MLERIALGELVTVFGIQHHSSQMWDFILYQCAVLTFILLYWFHKPKAAVTATASTQQASPGQGADSRVSQSKSNDSVDGDSSKGSLKNKARQRLSSIKRRKDLVEHDIIINLGLNPDERGFEAFCDRFSTFEYVSEALVQAGFCSCDIIVGIDFTASNEWQGKRSFSKTNLHKTNGSKIYNPYQKVLHILGKTLSFLSSDHVIHSFGFGDVVTKDHSVFPLCKDETTPCSDYHQVIEAYTQMAKRAQLSGPTNFAPMVNKAISLCQRTNKYHVLIMIVDGQVFLSLRTADY